MCINPAMPVCSLYYGIPITMVFLTFLFLYTDAPMCSGCNLQRQSPPIQRKIFLICLPSLSMSMCLVVTQSLSACNLLSSRNYLLNCAVYVHLASRISCFDVNSCSNIKDTEMLFLLDALKSLWREEASTYVFFAAIGKHNIFQPTLFLLTS